MFGFVSVSQLSADIRAKIHLIPSDIDLVVGIPRSGMIPAYMIGLLMNRLVTDLETFLANGTVGHGQTRKVGKAVAEPLGAKHILLVDDSAFSGSSMRQCLERVQAAGFTGTITTCAVIVLPGAGANVDVFFREMPDPRIFEWNAFQHPHIGSSCFDLDGILCVDPTDYENDDGPRYERFLRTARPLIRPTRRIGHIVSARLEKYRGLTEEWLESNHISYGQLHLIDLPSKEERQRLGAHSTHKASVYRETSAFLFYESEIRQASQIAHQSGRPVLCTADMSMHLPSGFHLNAGLKKLKWRLKRPLGRVKGWLRQRPLRAPL